MEKKKKRGWNGKKKEKKKAERKSPEKVLPRVPWAELYQSISGLIRVSTCFLSP